MHDPLNNNFIVGLTGYKQVGKSTTAAIMSARIKELGRKRCILGFADALKEELAEKTGFTVEEIEKRKDEFRTLLQVWGTDFRRKITDPDYWIKKFHHIYCSYKDTIFIVPDVRFMNELDYIKFRGGIIVRVYNDRVSKTDSHISEQEIALADCDYKICNHGDLLKLEQHVHAFMDWYSEF